MKKILYLLLFSVICPFLTQAQGFTIVGSELHDANGNNFIIKGINVPLAWYSDDVNNNIANIRKNTNANTLRIVVQTNTPDNVWQTCVQNCINNQMIPMVELHDVTGLNNVDTLKKMAAFWASKASFFNKPEIAKYILINIANEWSDWTTANTASSAWRDTYIACVKTLRDAGIKTTIVVDAPGYGQDGKGHNVLTYGPAVESADPLKNVLFSIHMYCEWSKTGNLKIATDFLNIKNNVKSPLPIIVGEFGWQENDGSGTKEKPSYCDIDESLIISTCKTNGIGWLAWSWKGNNSTEAFLDLSTDWAGTSLTTWGDTIVNGLFGTKTAITASVFTTITGIDEDVESNALVINPNPVGESISIKLASANTNNYSFSISNSVGEVFQSGKFSGNVQDVDLHSMPSGLYFAKVVYRDQVLIKKFIKK